MAKVNTTALLCEPICGDGLLVAGEGCDDGNKDNSTVTGPHWLPAVSAHSVVRILVMDAVSLVRWHCAQMCYVSERQPQVDHKTG